MNRNVLLVDDEPNTLKVLSAALKKHYRVDTAKSAEEALSKFNQGEYSLVISDFRLPGMDGMQLLERVKESVPGIPFIMLTAFGTIERAVDAMKKGAYTYLTKPVNIDALLSITREALHRQDDGASGKDSDDSADRHEFMNLVGKSAAVQEVVSMIKRVSKTDAGILILGESGTGKEIVARAIHHLSLRACGPFIAIDCTTIPEDLVESELFGYDKGAFTCAYTAKIGLLEMADSGTVFFDEIGDLDFRTQKKLLRFIQEKEFHRLGGKAKRKVDARVVAATNRDMEEAVKRGDFRADLFHRLNVIAIQIPPLRERREDIPLLMHHFLQAQCRKIGKQITGFDPGVIDVFQSYEWLGNVRELENVVERAVILCPADVITAECLPQKLSALMSRSPSAVLDTTELSLPEIERRVVLSALEKTSWNQSKAAGILGISRKKLRTKMKNFAIPFDGPPSGYARQQ
jgi:two-component system response regulator HydG/two-component system response regulator AtoC